ncbi:MAG: hypothetical protein LKF36_14320 [Lactobacillus sp.]|jgi:hypothetical protein|nr:hypothetical protein [Lactobacillus sp.]
MSNEPYSQTVANLLTEVKDAFHVPVTVTVSGNASGLLLHDQSQQVVHKDGSIEVKVTDTTNVDYTLSHELLHMLMATRGFSQLQFPLTTENPQLDEQIGATATALYNSAAHVVILADQQKHGLINATITKEFLDGVYASVPAEDPNKAEDPLLIFRMLSLLDLFVFLEGDINHLKNDLLLKYPESYPYAKGLYDTLSAKKIDTAFAFRRAVIALFRKFAAILDSLGYVPMNHGQFAVLTPIFSQRQLRLSVNQVIEILHSEYLDLKTKQRAYIAVGKTDQQAAFLFQGLKQDMSPEAFQALYDQPLQTILNQEKVQFGIR